MSLAILGTARRWAVCLTLLTAPSPSAVAGDAPVIRPGKAADHGVKDADLDALRALLKKAVDDKQVPGVSLLLAVKGEVLFQEAFGDLEVEQPVRIASSTKPVAATAVLAVVDQGKLSLDDPLVKYVPEFKGTKAEKATVRQLLSHTAGIPSVYPGGRPQAGTLAEFARTVARKGTLAEPGTFRYSGVSIDLAGRCAEAAAGVPFEDLVRKHVWEPLGMKQSSFWMAADPKSVTKDDLARGEGRYVSGGGGRLASLEDMARFYQMHLNGGRYGDRQVLSPRAVAAMRTKHATNPRRGETFFGNDYGLGFYLARWTREVSPLVQSHGGAFGTMPWLDAERDLVAVCFTQVGLQKAAGLIGQVERKVRDIVPPTRKAGTGTPPPEGKKPPEEAARRFLKGAAQYADVKAYCDLGEHRPSTRENLKTAAWLAGELTKTGLKAELLPLTGAQVLPCEGQAKHLATVR